MTREPREQLRIEYDDQPDDIVRKINRALTTRGLRLIDDGELHEGFLLLTLEVDSACEIVQNGGPYQYVDDCVHVSAKEFDGLKQRYDRHVKRMFQLDAALAEAIRIAEREWGAPTRIDPGRHAVRARLRALRAIAEARIDDA